MGAIFGLLGIVWVDDLSETNLGPPRFSWINVTPPNSSARVFVSHTCFLCRERAKFCLKLEAKYQPAHGLDPSGHARSSRALDEAAVPSIYWEPREPRLDRQGLANDLKQSANAGVALSNPEPVLSVRTR